MIYYLKAMRKKKNNLSAFSDLAQSALSRHNIGSQVRAAMIVTFANTELEKFLAQDIAKECEVLSYKHGVLRIFLGTPLISDHVKAQEVSLIDAVHKQFPQITINRIQYSFTR